MRKNNADGGTSLGSKTLERFFVFFVAFLFHSNFIAFSSGNIDNFIIPGVGWGLGKGIRGVFTYRFLLIALLEFRLYRDFF
jgi:hypothetical protein